jgi:hypothetical protein
LRKRTCTGDQDAGQGKNPERTSNHAGLPRSEASPSASVCTSSC